MTNKIRFTTLVMGIVAMLAANALAVTVTVNGTTRFDSGGFEAETPGTDPATPTVGSYTLTQASGANVEVFDAITPGANEGSNYLSLEKPNVGGDWVLGAYMGFSEVAIANDVISAEFAIQMDSAKSPYSTFFDRGEMHAFFALSTGSTTDGSTPWNKACTWVGFVPCGGDSWKASYTDPSSTNNPLSMVLDFTGMGADDLFMMCYNGSAWQQVFDTTGAPLSASFDAWYDIGIDYTVGSGAFTISVDDATSTPMGLANNATANIAGLQLFANVDSQGQAAIGYYIDSVAAEVPEKIPGDANNDKKVDGSDVTILAGNWQVGVDGMTEATWEMGDFNGDKKVDGSDVTILAGNWQAGVTATAAAVPEPGTIILILSAISSLLVWRRFR